MNYNDLNNFGYDDPGNLPGPATPCVSLLGSDDVSMYLPQLGGVPTVGGITPYGLSTPEVPTEFLPSKGTEEKDDPLYLSLTSGNMWEADDYPEGLGTIEDVYFKADEDVDYDPDYDFGHVFDESLNICDGPVNPPLPWPLD